MTFKGGKMRRGLGASRQLSAAFFGGALNGTEHTALYNALNTYLTGIGGA